MTTVSLVGFLQLLILNQHSDSTQRSKEWSPHYLSLDVSLAHSSPQLQVADSAVELSRIMEHSPLASVLFSRPLVSLLAN
jgi:hypothetical protein